MKHITDMIPLATGNIRQRKRSKPRRSMNAARLNTTRKRRNWTNSMNCKSKTGKRLFNIRKAFPIMFTAWVFFLWKSWKSTFLMMWKRNDRRNLSSKMRKKKYRIHRRNSMNILTWSRFRPFMEPVSGNSSKPLP